MTTIGSREVGDAARREVKLGDRLASDLQPLHDREGDGDDHESAAETSAHARRPDVERDLGHQHQDGTSEEHDLRGDGEERDVLHQFSPLAPRNVDDAAELGHVVVGGFLDPFR